MKPNQPVQLKFAIHDPWKDRPVTDFQIVHEKLFHMFVVSQDLQFFVHDHPVFEPDGDFRYDIAFPKPGMYRVLGDFYPDGATPQLIAKTMIRGGNAPAAGFIPRDYSTKHAENMQVEMTTDPPQPSPRRRRSFISPSSQPTDSRSTSARGGTCWRRATT